MGPHSHRSSRICRARPATCRVVRGADLLIHDAQHTAVEYLAKTGWGRSSVAPRRAFLVGLTCDAEHEHKALEILRRHSAQDIHCMSYPNGLAGRAMPAVASTHRS